MEHLLQKDKLSNKNNDFKETTPSPPTTPPEEIPDRELAFEFQQAMLDHNLSLYFQPIIHLKPVWLPDLKP